MCVVVVRRLPICYIQLRMIKKRHSFKPILRCDLTAILYFFKCLIKFLSRCEAFQIAKHKVADFTKVIMDVIQCHMQGEHSFEVMEENTYNRLL